MRLELAVRPRRLEVPEKQLALAVARRDELAVGREGDAAGVARVQVALERPLPLLLDPFSRGIGDNRVVHGLAAPELLRRMLPDDGHGVHVRLAYVFGGNGYRIFPHKYFFVVARRNEGLAVVDERDGITRRQMMIVYESGLLLPQIPLEDLT